MTKDDLNKITSRCYQIKLEIEEYKVKKDYKKIGLLLGEFMSYKRQLNKEKKRLSKLENASSKK